jgi:hypothetical protein
MKIVISPAKSLFNECPVQFKEHSIPVFLNESEKIIRKLQKLTPEKIAGLMNISQPLAQLNYNRFQNWEFSASPTNGWQAVFMFNGDVYQGLKATTMTEEELYLAQEKIRILSGVYGLLKPLDLIQPYRLEMGTALAIGQEKDLYAFWQHTITTELNNELSKEHEPTLINLASVEYFSAIDTKKLKARLITPTFKEQKNGQYKIVSFFAKKARGLMSRFIIQNKINDPENIKAFDLDGYYFNNNLSKGDNWVFTR